MTTSHSTTGKRLTDEAQATRQPNELRMRICCLLIDIMSDTKRVTHTLFEDSDLDERELAVRSTTSRPWRLAKVRSGADTFAQAG